MNDSDSIVNAIQQLNSSYATLCIESLSRSRSYELEQYNWDNVTSTFINSTLARLFPMELVPNSFKHLTNHRDAALFIFHYLDLNLLHQLSICDNDKICVYDFAEHHLLLPKILDLLASPSVNFAVFSRNDQISPRSQFGKYLRRRPLGYTCLSGYSEAPDSIQNEILASIQLFNAR